MSEDYTYTAPAVIAVRAADLDALRQRVQELERENAELRADWVDKNDVLNQTLQVMEFAEGFKRRAEAAEAALAAVPVEALRFWRNPFGGNLTAERIDTAWDAITTWLDAQEVPTQPDDPDAPLTLAAIDDEDGDL